MILTSKQREIINLLVSAQMEANNARPYDNVQYYACHSAISVYLDKILGPTIYSVITNSKEGFNWGGNKDYAEDVIAAVNNITELQPIQISEIRKFLKTFSNGLDFLFIVPKLKSYLDSNGFTYPQSHMDFVLILQPFTRQIALERQFGYVVDFANAFKL